MKTAVCLHGIIGGKIGKNGAGGVVDFYKCADSLRQNIVEPNNSDVFYHSWSYNLAGDLRLAYPEAKRYTVEPQKTFGLDIGKQFNRFIYYSRWTSLLRSLELVGSGGECYDMVYVGRFDLLWKRPLRFSEYDASKIWVSHWNRYPDEHQGWDTEPDKSDCTFKAKRVLDLWMFGNHCAMKTIGDIARYARKYERLGKRFDPHKTIWAHLERNNEIKNLKCTMYRNYDYDLIRCVR